MSIVPIASLVLSTRTVAVLQRGEGSQEREQSFYVASYLAWLPVLTR